MNRAVYLLRPDKENHDDLRRTAIELVTQGPHNQGLIAELPKITNAYIQLVEKERKTPMYRDRVGGHFTGLRDFYSFVKLIDKMLRQKGRDLDSETLLHAIFRSFGGFADHDIVPILAKPFWTQCQALLAECNGPEGIKEYRSKNILHLLRANVTDVAKEPEGEREGEIGARHLMVLSRHVTSALSILEDESIIQGDGSKKAKVLTGSPFPEDQSTLTMFRRVTQVRQCMETGRTVVLLHQDGIYTSLYDMLNQNYTDGVAGGKFCRLAIGSRSRQCEVHPNFRCVVIVDSNQAWKELPSPLLNRFEKMCVSVRDLLEPEFRQTEDQLWQLCRDFAKVATLKPFESDLGSLNNSAVCPYLRSVFVGFNEEMLPSMLLRLQRAAQLTKRPFRELPLRPCACRRRRFEGNLAAEILHGVPVC